jgi:hypothetical protein
VFGAAFLWLYLLVPLPVIGAFQQSHRIRHHLRPLVERLVPTAQRLWRRNVHHFNRARVHRAKAQRAIQDSGADIG